MAVLDFESLPISGIISGHSTYSDEGKISYESLTPSSALNANSVD